MDKLFDYLSAKYQPVDMTQVNQRLVELSSLFETSQILNSTIDLDKILNNILLIPMGRLMISRGVIYLREKQQLSPRISKGLPEDISGTAFLPEDFPFERHFLLENESPEKNSFSRLTSFMKKYHLFLAIPIRSNERLIGLCFYGSKLNRQPFSKTEIEFLNSLANISATAVENALKVEEIRLINLELDQKIQQLKTLFDINQGLSATLDKQKILKLLSYSLMGQMLVNQYAIILQNPERKRIEEIKGFDPEIVESMLDELFTLKSTSTATLVSQLLSQPVGKKLDNLGAQVVIPMWHHEKVIGLIILGKKINQTPYTQTDLEFLTTLVSQATVSLENARLFIETLEKQRMEQELQVARHIQIRLLPNKIPEIPGYDVHGLNIPSKEVGGDYFDVIPISETRFALAIGDVSGKSVPASLLMANLQAGLRLSILDEKPLNHIVQRINKLIFENTDLDKYITFFIGVLDTQTHELAYVNAGHNPPIFISRENEITLLEVGGIILGLFEEFDYKMGKIRFQPGDLLFCYTDGVNEAENRQGDEFGEKRLLTLLKKVAHRPTREIAEKIVSEIQSFSQGVEQFDDITLLALKRIK